MSAARHEFEHLQALMGGWFHQDFDIVGSTVEEIIANYREESAAEEQEGTREDIRRFLAEHADDGRLIGDFMETFHPSLIDKPWGMTIREFLMKIEALLA